MLRPTVLPLDSIRLSWHSLAEKLHAQQPPKAHQRRAHEVNGVPRPEVTVLTRPKALCDGEKASGLTLIMWMRRMAQRLLSQAVLSEALLGPDGRFQLPPLLVNARKLREHRGLSEVTMRKHLKTLQQVGLITRRKFRGTRASFHVWINPDFVWETPVETPVDSVAADSEARPEALFLDPNHKNLSHTEVLESQEPLQEKVVRVDKLPHCRQTGTPLLEPEGRTGKPAPAAGQAAKTRHRGRAAARAERQAPLTGEAAQQAQQARIEGFLTQFFQYSRTLLYASLRPFSELETQWTLQAIWAGQYRPLLAATPENRWEQVHQSLLRRVELARDYFQRHPDAYPALPWAEVHAGRGYFDAGNGNGFERTRVWMARKLNRKQGGLSALDRALDCAEREIQQRRALDAGLKVQASDRAKRHSLETLHWTHRTLLRRLAGEEGLARLAARLDLLGMASA